MIFEDKVEEAVHAIRVELLSSKEYFLEYIAEGYLESQCSVKDSAECFGDDNVMDVVGDIVRDMYYSLADNVEVRVTATFIQ